MVYENSPHPVVRDRLIAGDEEKRPARHLQETTEHFGRFFEAEIQVEVSGSGSAPSSKLWTSSTKLQRRQHSTIPRQHLYITCLFLNCNSPIHLLAFWQPRLLE
jgi:hypothetical protein